MRLHPAPLAAVAALAFLAAGCAVTSGGAAPSAPPAVVLDGRAPDGLLARPDLQALVDLQVRRDADGLIAALASPDSVVRARAAFALGSVQAPEAVPALRAALSDEAPSVRADAAFALGQSADSTAGVALLVSLRTEAAPAVLAELLDAVGKTGGRADIAPLLQVPLPDGLEARRTLALARMGLRGVTSNAWAQALAVRLGAPDAQVREAAAYAFSRAPVSAWRDQAAALRTAFDGIGPQVSGAGRGALARALGRLEDPQDAGRLAAALADAPDWRARVDAARALGALGAAGRPALARATDDPNPHVAQVAFEQLATDAAPPSPSEVALALDAVGGRRPWPVQAAALPLLARAGRGEAVAAWADRQQDPFARAAALRALGVADDAASRARLFAEAGGADVRSAAAALGALRQRWEAGTSGARPFYDAFSQGLRRADLATATESARALADSAFWPLGAGALLRDVYADLDAPADVEPMVEILRAAGQIRDGSEVDFLVGVALQGGHPVLRRAARDALNDRLTEGVEVDLAGEGGVETTSVDWDFLARLGSAPRLVLDTDRGRVEIELDVESAPQTAQRIAATAARDLYDGVPFHRVVPAFVVQGGDYTRRDGYGGPATPIRSEFTRLRFTTGTAGMASAGKDTEGAQFFVTHGPQPHLDGRYTAFGRVVAGQDVVDRILQGDLIRSARIARD
ncbi:peptidylprolyl isomerase [Rubrivirga sp. S365]|uniref:peptidylprolyl isomerase n=1 Tax=Rubrivirga sp. S365 TaxID=3076080 RepID=UPI0028C51249|nr:peptidylprolyl isomerase [Rubrivirga sp. S365]MDT7857648.1 peptidylprolyl isomerase [Rubrivirga sp. S365]